MEKKLKIPTEKLRRLIQTMGACSATDMITVESKEVGWMCRVEPETEGDSGWRFLAGDESADYLDNPDNHGIYDVNTICNYDQSIIPFLHVAPGTAYERDPNMGVFVKVDFEESQG
jgi:hypothetical protein